ncbi:Tetrahydromethanopterin S-methyltransferase subunit A homolog [hydrothermal vent metagenome]|uniref:Tetrahydromethanopterin S-methyltransferase subunit A homolog n=1 Tax=hydrothermal vent metagenome TaxID=652676 RepID=A0A3B1BRV0_9ZZZZ
MRALVTEVTKVSETLTRLEAELRKAMAAKKCWRCGCFQDTVNTLQNSEQINASLPALLDEARTLFEPKRYDCLGCEVCWPAVAQNLAAESDPAVAEGGHCATIEPELQQGWPPLPGDYRVIRFQAPVAVCTLNSDDLITQLSSDPVKGLAVVGSLHTENLGIEHLIRNLLSNPNIRFLLICGEDTQRAIGHLPGQSLASLLRYGINEKGRIIEAKGKRPFIKNLDPRYIDSFRQQVQLIDHIGEMDPASLRNRIEKAACNDPGPVSTTAPDMVTIPVENAIAPQRLRLDPAGYFVVYPDQQHKQITLEHYSNKGVLDRIFNATDPAALYTTVIDAGLISRLDHAAYLGRELARAEHSLINGEAYVQDRAAGDIQEVKTEKQTACGCTSLEDESCN